MNEVAEKTETVNESETDQAQEQQFEIKLDSPSDVRKGSPMVTRIIGQRDKARTERDGAKSENEELRHRLANLENQLQGKANQVPQYEDFADQQEYQSAVQNYYAKHFEATSSQPNVDPFQQFTAQQKLNSGIDKHYKRAEELAAKFPDYSVAEQTAKQMLGDSVVLDIATRANNSAELMLYFGKNPNEAARFKQLVQSDPTNAAIELGRLDQKIKIESKNKTDAIEPDGPLVGGSVKSVSSQSMQKQLDKIRGSGDIRATIEFKKAAKAQGIYLE